MSHIMWVDYLIEDHRCPGHAQPSMVMTVKRNWAELDAGLPILHAVRLARPRWRIVVIVQEARMQMERDRFPALMRQLQAVADTTVWLRHAPGSARKIKRTLPDGRRVPALTHVAQTLFSAISAPLLGRREHRTIESRTLPRGPVQALLHNHKAETPLERRLRRASPRALRIGFHHGSHPTVPGPDRAAPAQPSRGAPTDLFLAKTKDEADLVHFPGRTPMIRTIGLPKYDGEWLNRLLPTQDQLDETEQFRQRHERCWLFLTRGPTNEAMDEGDYSELLSALAKVLQKRPHVGLLVKPHPREDLEALRSVLPGEEGTDWMITDQPPYALARTTELTIAMWSSVILDAAAAGAPVIELYRFRHPSHYLAHLPGRRLGSTHAAMNLCTPARDEAELEAALTAWEEAGWDHATWAPKRDAVRTLIGDRPGDALAHTARVLGTALPPDGTNNQRHNPRCPNS